ncbi:Uncharacterized protein Fot_26194 [Forsythia ovata]|uniref:Uncharacterized protein n=1 Tax=Forsythia ovata TaxID=205694 RepID=A0ABD1UB70_9LAMI
MLCRKAILKKDLPCSLRNCVHTSTSGRFNGGPGKLEWRRREKVLTGAAIVIDLDTPKETCEKLHGKTFFTGKPIGGRTWDPGTNVFKQPWQMWRTRLQLLLILQLRTANSTTTT